MRICGRPSPGPASCAARSPGRPLRRTRTLPALLAGAGLPAGRGAAGRALSIFRPASCRADEAGPAKRSDEQQPVPTLFPSNRERQTLHVMSPKAHVGRSGESLVVTAEDEERETTTQRVPIEEIDALVVHGFGQVTTQAIHCVRSRGVAVQWMTTGGKFAAGTTGFARARAAANSAVLGLGRMSRPLAAGSAGSCMPRSKRNCGICCGRRAATRRLRASVPDRISSGFGNRCGRSPLPGPTRIVAGLGRDGGQSVFRCHAGASRRRRCRTEMRPIGRSKHPPRDRFNCAA